MICEKNHEYTKTHKTGGCPVCFNNERYLEYSKKYNADWVLCDGANYYTQTRVVK